MFGGRPMRLLITGFLRLSLFLLPKGALAAQHGRVFSRLTETGSVNFRDHKDHYSTKTLAILGLGSEAGGALDKTTAGRKLREWYQDSQRTLKQGGSSVKKMFPFFIVLLGIGLILHACTAYETKPVRVEMLSRPTASGAALWDYLKAVNYAKSWRMWPGKTPFYPGAEPHGSLLVTYVNNQAYRAIEEKKGMFPDEAIVVKENYAPDQKLAALTVMYKVKGYDPEANDWFWATYQPDGKIQAEGKVEMCINCHGAKRDNDYIMTAPLK